MDWGDLRIFLAVARTGRLTAAATLLGQDPTTVSRRLKRLETVLQRRLFEHAQAGHVITEHGRQLLTQAERMEAAALGIERLEASPALGGTIRVSTSEGFGSRVLAPRLGAFLAIHPGVQVDLIASSGFLNPSRREADLAIMLARPRTGALIATKLTDYRLGLYATAAYLAGAPPLDAVDQLTAHILVGYVPDQIYAPELRYLAELDQRLTPHIRSTSINAQAEIVASGTGVGILPCFLARQMPALVRLLPGEVDIQRSFWLVVPKDLRGIARIDRFVTWLKQEIEAVRPMLAG